MHTLCGKQYSATKGLFFILFGCNYYLLSDTVFIVNAEITELLPQNKLKNVNKVAKSYYIMVDKNKYKDL